MAWKIEYFKEVRKDFIKLDYAQRLQVLKAIEKVSKNPLSKYEGGYGKPLSNNSTTKLAGCYKIKLLKLGIRIVCFLVKEDNIMKIVLVSVRTDDVVYKLANKRIK
ncbi:MAG: type II toxin-antitoxin system RelE family toxin [Alkaliphilus sp.]